MQLEKYLLKRVAENKDGTFGVLIHNDNPFALTLENPWLDNEVNVSCIPLGSYRCKRYVSERFGSTFAVLDVDGRSGIAFHAGNTKEDTKGCILIGEEFGFLEKQTAILASKRGFNEFLRMLDGQDDFELTIVNA